MKRTVLALTAVAALMILSSQANAAEAKAKKAEAKTPADRVVVIYFHRTQRCPTCQKMGGYSEEAVVKGFAKQVKDRTVEFHYIDFQDKKNEALAKGYRVTGPALIVVKVVKNKPVEIVNLQEIWTRNRDKEDFFKYVRDNIVTLQKTAEKSRKTEKQDVAT